VDPVETVIVATVDTGEIATWFVGDETRSQIELLFIAFVEM